MSTTYHALRPPVTHIRIEPGGGHHRIGVWINHAKAGELVVRPEEVPSVTLWFADEFNEVAETISGPTGIEVLERVPDLRADMLVISEYGDLMTMADVRGRRGKRAEQVTTILQGKT